MNSQDSQSIDLQKAINDNKQYYNTVESSVETQDFITPSYLRENPPVSDNFLNLSINLDDLQKRMSDVISNYLTDLQSQPTIAPFMFENLPLAKSESLDAEQEFNVKEGESILLRQRIYKKIVEKLSLQVITSLRSIGTSSSSNMSSRVMQETPLVMKQENFIKEDMTRSSQIPSTLTSNENLLYTIQNLKQSIKFKDDEILCLHFKIKTLKENMMLEQNFGQNLSESIRQNVNPMTIPSRDIFNDLDKEKYMHDRTDEIIDAQKDLMFADVKSSLQESL